MLADCFAPVMGCSCVKPDGKFTKMRSESVPARCKPRRVVAGGAAVAATTENYKSNYYIAMALINANRAASLVVHDVCPGHLDALVAEQLIRKAKNDGRTVSVVNGCLYLDYKFAGFMPMLHI